MAPASKTSQPPPRGDRQHEPNNDDDDDDSGAKVAVQQSSLLHPRVAVVLGVSEGWHPPLFACRLLSTVPAAWWGFPIALRLLVHLHLLAAAAGVADGSSSAGVVWLRAGEESVDRRLRLMETILAIIWVRRSRSGQRMACGLTHWDISSAVPRHTFRSFLPTV